MTNKRTQQTQDAVTNIRFYTTKFNGMMKKNLTVLMTIIRQLCDDDSSYQQLATNQQQLYWFKGDTMGLGRHMTTAADPALHQKNSFEYCYAELLSAE